MKHRRKPTLQINTQSISLHSKSGTGPHKLSNIFLDFLFSLSKVWLKAIAGGCYIRLSQSLAFSSYRLQGDFKYHYYIRFPQSLAINLFQCVGVW